MTEHGIFSDKPDGTMIARFHFPKRVIHKGEEGRMILKFPCDDNLDPHCFRGDDIESVLKRGIMRTALVIDIHNLYLGSLRKYPGKVINYTQLTSYFASLGNSLFHKIAYGRQSEEEVASFAKMLRRNGFQLSFGNAPYNVEMTLKIAELIEHRAIDHLILGTNYFETGRILAHARNRGIYTTVFGFSIPRIFENYADILEVPGEFLQDRPPSEGLEVETA